MDKIDINSFTEDSIEHIMPIKLEKWKGDLSKYASMWSDSEYNHLDQEQKINIYHKTFLNDLGNLSLLTVIQNSELGNKNFEEKKKILQEQEKDNKLFETVISREKWSHEEIQSRRREFCDILKKIFYPDMKI